MKKTIDEMILRCKNDLNYIEAHEDFLHLKNDIEDELEVCIELKKLRAENTELKMQITQLRSHIERDGLM